MNEFNPASFAIVADIGGTNARFACVNLNDLTLSHLTVYKTENFPNFSEAFEAYRRAFELDSIQQVAIAVACPVQGDLICMTNTSWQFSKKALKQAFQLQTLFVLNDFMAIAMGLQAIAPTQKIQIGSGHVDLRQPCVLLGAGTGLGIAYLIPHEGHYIPIPSEGGHMTWVAESEQEYFILNFLKKRYGHVSSERILSGMGLENLYEALAFYRNETYVPLSASQIAAKALADPASLAGLAMLQFFKSLGNFAGNLALNLNTFGGVYLAGGIVPKVLPLIYESDFRNSFEKKGRFHAFNRQIATYVITEAQPGLLGASVYLQTQRMIQNEDVSLARQA